MPKYNIFAKTTWTIELILEVILVSLYGGALLSPYVSPQIVSIPAVLNLAFPIIFLFFVLMTVVYLLRRRWKYLIIHAILLIISISYLKSYFPITLKENEATQDLRVMTYNVSGFLPNRANSLSAENIIRNSEANIVCLQEAILSRDEAENALAFRKKFGKVYPHRDAHFDYKTHSQGLVLLSKYPIVKKHVIEYPYKTDGNASVAYLIRLPNDKKLLLVNNHMESYRLTKKEKDSYTNVTKENFFKRIPSLVRELYGRLGKPLSKRAQASREVQKEVKHLKDTYKPDYTIITGDMNDTPMSYTYSKMRSSLRDAYEDKGMGIGISYNEPLFYFRIDHLFYDERMTVLRAKLPRYKWSSDHNPLIVDFALPNQ
ncbi:endonuclease/exonuclease/phosphatase family protein [Porphyromonas cangingivalis]|uniref:Uncharacterized conserved protein YafD, endonuclease/exonuclease/phosphatase (EEP) superfamily n=1 Tax=Porphyromonas cangingivalis TaxID=36874 RepID=A0A1T4LUR0_PORCN|nr:endonuclease/exonuclease/phosphatase family protein [Porphyromonas cangingivalis]SJZ58366.1 Uncharacterized conserved protein YafD, endonuclease/exonuclease/phosphatase (EEP) superfamily [Porphyromonas cangingivalis]VEJ01984.1 Uncharacterized protein conserved in bacteria [Porphyromonas cangingivalis]